jgi:hypothetical protein
MKADEAQRKSICLLKDYRYGERYLLVLGITDDTAARCTYENGTELIERNSKLKKKLYLELKLIE